MLNRLRNFSGRPFVRNVITVASGTAAAQAIGIAFAPLITRLYGPEVFGLQALFVSVVGLLSTVAAMSYPIAIILPKSDADALGLARLSIYIGLAITVVAAIALSFFGNSLFGLLNADAIAAYAFLIPIAMFISVLSNVVSQWLIRKKEFSLSARYAIYSALMLNSAKTSLGFIHPTALVLIITNIIGSVVSAILTYIGWYRLQLTRRHMPRATTQPTSLVQLANRHRDFPLLRTPQNFINAISQSLPVLLLGYYFGASAAGQYTIAISVLGVPAVLIGGSVTAVFYPRINEALHNKENAKSLIIKATLGMAASGSLPFLMVLLAGPFIFRLAFGNAWLAAGVYAQWLSIWIFFQYINKPAVSAIPALGMQGGLLMYEIFSTSTKVLALWIGFSIYNDPVVAVALFSIGGSIAYLWLIFWVIRKSNRFNQRG